MDKINILVAPNSMKGSLDAFRFANAVEKAFQSVSSLFEIKKQAVADGGDFTAEILSAAFNLHKRTVNVNDPLGRSISASYGIKDEIAVIEMADSSGMKLLKDHELNPLKTTSWGMGQMLLDALQNRASNIYLGVGGSATVDGGMGLLQALGVHFFDSNDNKLGTSGKHVGYIHHWNDSALKQLPEFNVKVVCDVNNPLLGINGAVSVFAPQKGATKQMLPILENNLSHFAKLIQNEKKHSLKNLSGMGAAGGVNLALVGFLGASITPGAELVLDLVDFNKSLKHADIVITGEGKIDYQTKNMKAPYAIACRAKQKGVPVFAIGGVVTKQGAKLFDQAYSLVDNNTSPEFAMQHAEELVFTKAREIATELLKKYEKDK